MTDETRNFPKPLLGGRSARIVVTMGMPAFIYRWWFGSAATRALAAGLLRLSGLKPVRQTVVGGTGGLTPAKAAAHLKAMDALGRRAA